ncbi:MAG: hypothetical protein U5K31_05570 [Balneolaceae bacterium]|nr:hypothetical protein [Balneolaceae bacterium]
MPSKLIYESQEVVERGEETVNVRLYVRVNDELKALVRSYGIYLILVQGNGTGSGFV